MSKRIFEIRFHSRAGQGAKSAAALLAEAALSMGKQVQAFPQYGPERGGAPMKAFVRISDSKIYTYAPVIEPDVVAVFDDSLLDKEVVHGLSSGILLVNTKKPSEAISKITGFKGKIYSIDATGIALDILARNFPNMPILGALVRLTKIVDLRFVTDRIRKHFTLRINEDIAKKDVLACKRGYEAVK